MLDHLGWLAEPGVVLAWYAAGVAGAGWTIVDEYRVNTQVPAAMKWAWPVIVFFFSVIGLGLYLATARPPGIAQMPEPQARAAYQCHVSTTFRRVTGSVIHCVGGDGLGIVTAMVLARVWRMSFWEEFWFEYAAGFAFGWFIFQYKAMREMAGTAAGALWMGGRAEFFSMMAVMGGMGGVMAFVTPLVVGQQPSPATAAFWGFAAFGLFAGFVLTYPMNWWLVAIRWKHGG
jgi:hypothetical protein